MGNPSVKGSIDILVDIAELEASLSYKPDPAGREWTVESLAAEATKRGLSSVGRQTLEAFLSKAAASPSGLSAVIAKGIPPEQPQAEAADWIREPVPEEIREAIEEKLKKSPPPAAVSGGEGTAADAKVSGYAYVEAGQKIGSLSAAKPGRNGKSVFGRPLPASRPQGGSLAFDKSITRTGRDLFASVSGILRHGQGWADILPFRVRRCEVSKAADGSAVLLDFDPGDSGGAPPDAREILEKAAKLGSAPEDLMEEGELAAALREAAEKRSPLSGFCLSKGRDASIEIVVSPDKLKATLNLAKAKGRGKSLDLRELTEKLKASGVRLRNADRFKEDVLSFVKGPKAELKDYALAEGRAPGKDKDRTMTVIAPFLSSDKAAAVKERISAAADGLKELKGLDEYPLLDFQKVCSVEEGKQALSLTKAEPGAPGVDVLGAPVPPEPGAGPSIKCYDGVRFSLDSVTPLVSGVMLYREADNVVSLRALEYRDAEAEVDVSPDGMSAKLLLFKGLGIGLPLTVDSAMAALKAAGVVYGVDEAAVKAAVDEANAAKNGQPTEREAAKGKPPRAPASRAVEWRVQLASGKAVTLNAAGRADYRNQDRITVVKDGDLIAVLQKQEDAGEAGSDVRGKKIDPPKSEAGGDLGHDASVREEPAENGAVKLVAAKSGELHFEKNVLSITQAFSVKGDVDMKTGNLRFPGNVTVSGSVASGFQLISGGDVSIGEGVEDSLVSADGSVRIAQGIRGRGRGTVSARKGVELLFAENAKLMSVEDVKVKNACVACDVKTNGKLLLLTEKGKLIGGRVRARNGIDVQNLGSEANVKTEVSFGQDYLVYDLLEAEHREIEKVKLALLEYERRIKEAEKAGGERLAKLRQDKVKLMKLLEKRSVRFWTLDDKFEAHFPSEVRVRGTIYPGVILESHNRRLEITAEKTKVVFIFDPSVGRIVESALPAGR